MLPEVDTRKWETHGRSPDRYEKVTSFKQESARYLVRRSGEQDMPQQVRVAQAKCYERRAQDAAVGQRSGGGLGRHVLPEIGRVEHKTFVQ